MGQQCPALLHQFKAARGRPLSPQLLRSRLSRREFAEPSACLSFDILLATSSVLPTCGPKLNTPRMPKPAQKCMKPCRKPVAAKKAGTKRLSRQRAGTWNKTRPNQRMPVAARTGAKPDPRETLAYWRAPAGPSRPFVRTFGSAYIKFQAVSPPCPFGIPSSLSTPFSLLPCHDV